jgi:S1-C subfamily serine protease
MLGVASAGTVSNFRAVRAYDGRFADISARDWYYESVASGYEYGYFDGRSAAAFAPRGTVTVAEAVKLAVTLSRVYSTGSCDISDGSPVWHSTYFAAAVELGIVGESEFPDKNAAVTRGDFAKLFARALPDEVYSPQNSVPWGAVPDVRETFSYAPAVYALYRAGIVDGGDSRHNFFPNRTITRAEAAAILTRIVKASERLSFSIAANPAPLSGDELYAACAPAVFKLELYLYDEKRTPEREDDVLIGYGSGFLISPNGTALTNCHVASNFEYAVAVFADGTSRDVEGIYDRDLFTDSAIIKIAGSGLPYLKTRDSSQIRTGEDVFAIGSPLGLGGTFSRGIIASATRELEGTTYIQLDASISPGSSGGVLIDANGYAIGITSATVVGGQNLNLAIPVNTALALSTASLKSIQAFEAALPYYPLKFPTPDFGKYSGEQALLVSRDDLSDEYCYRLQTESRIEGYKKLLGDNRFILVQSPDGQFSDTVYYCGFYGTYVSFGNYTRNGVTYFRVQIFTI